WRRWWNHSWPRHSGNHVPGGGSAVCTTSQIHLRSIYRACPLDSVHRKNRVSLSASHDGSGGATFCMVAHVAGAVSKEAGKQPPDVEIGARHITLGHFWDGD